jgi:hypothetical protein
MCRFIEVRGFYCGRVGCEHRIRVYVASAVNDSEHRNPVWAEVSMTKRRDCTSGEMLQCLQRLPNRAQLFRAISRITTAYLSDMEPWVVGYSGGKDSTAVVKLVFQSLLRLRRARKAVTVSTATRESRYPWPRRSLDRRSGTLK